MIAKIATVMISAFMPNVFSKNVSMLEARIVILLFARCTISMRTELRR